MYTAVGYLEDLPGFMFSLKTLNAIQSFFLSTIKMAMTPVNTSSKATVPMTAAPLDSLTSRIGRNVFAPKHLTHNLLDRKIIQFKKILFPSFYYYPFYYYPYYCHLVSHPSKFYISLKPFFFVFEWAWSASQ